MSELTRYRAVEAGMRKMFAPASGAQEVDPCLTCRNDGLTRDWPNCREFEGIPPRLQELNKLLRQNGVHPGFLAGILVATFKDHRVVFERETLGLGRECFSLSKFMAAVVIALDSGTGHPTMGVS